jgi:hypothetical protein
MVRMPIVPPGSQAEVPRTDHRTECGDETVTMAADLAIRQAQPGHGRRLPAQALQRLRRFLAPSRAEVESPFDRARVASLPVAHRKNLDRNPPRKQGLQEARRSENLIVRVWCDDNYSARANCFECGQSTKLRGLRPLRLRRTRPAFVDD